MKHAFFATLFAGLLALLAITAPPPATAQSEVYDFYEAAYNDTTKNGDADSDGWHGPIDVNFEESDSLDLEFHFQGPFWGNATLVRESDVVSFEERRKDSIPVFSYDSTVYFSDDEIVSIPFWKLQALARDAGVDELSGEWELWMHILPGVTWTEKFKIVGVLERGTAW